MAAIYIFLAASRAYDDFLNELLILLFCWGKMNKMIAHLPDYVSKCDVPGSQGRQYRDSNNCTHGCLTLVEHATDGMKDYREEMPKPKPRACRLR